MKKSGFTLVEMILVLLVIALVAHSVTGELSRIEERKRTLAADRQLETLRSSVWTRDGGSGEAAGFLADMGRMPRANDGTLSELWTLPAAARRFAVLPATAQNLVVPDGEKAELADASVFVPTGWRGPYVRLPLGRSELTDPWGNPVATEDSAGLCRVWVTNGAVAAVSHYGSKAEARSMRSLSMEPDGGASSRLVVTAELAAGDGAPGTITYKWYGPADGFVTGAVATVAYPAAAVFEGLTPGTRILKDSVSGAARRIDVLPGDNLVHLKLAIRN